MAEWEKVVSVYDTVDRAKSALNVHIIKVLELTFRT
jgi:hypothetical protein